ncbi:MAG: transglutaminase TgpA family protein [Terriglobia bacterium]
MAGSSSTSPAGRINRQAHISVQRYFEIALLLMLGSSFFTLASTGALDAVSTGLFSAALGVKLWSYARGESGLRLSPRVVTRLAIAYLFFFLLDLTLLARGAEAEQRVLRAAIHLILFVTVVKIFSARRYRDYGYLAALSFMMMLAAAVLTVKIEYLLGLAFYVLLAIAMFISYEVKRGIETSEAPPRGPYASPARNRVAVENSLLLAAAAVAASVAALGVILFFVIPRAHGSHFSSLGFEAQNVTGFSENIDLGDIGTITTSSAVVMRVKVNGSARAFDGVKWRGIALDTFTGRGWRSARATTRRAIAPVAPGRFLLEPDDGWGGRPRHILRYQVLLSGLSTDIIFAAAHPREIDGRLASLSVDDTGSLHSPRGPALFAYSVVSAAGLPSPAALRTAGEVCPPEIRRVDLSLPAIDPRIRPLARTITRAATGNDNRALAIQNYLRSNFAYTLAPPSSKQADPLGSFLFQTKKGYCAYFSSAMAVMLRTLGIPARVVNGFQTGTFNSIGGDFVVRARDAHSWVEVYFPGYGWVPFDPTPPGPAPGASWSALGDYLDAASLFWNEWIINYDFAHQALLARQSNQDLRRLRANSAESLAGLIRRTDELLRRAARAARTHLPLALGAILAGFAAALLRPAMPTGVRLRLLLRRVHNGATPQSTDATLGYRQFLRAMRTRGFQKPDAQTPQEFARTLADPDVGPRALEFTRLYNALRFGAEPEREFWLLLRGLIRGRKTKA